VAAELAATGGRSSSSVSSIAAPKSRITTTSVTMVTLSTVCVNGPSALSEETTAIADEGDLGTRAEVRGPGRCPGARWRRARDVSGRTCRSR